MKYSFVAPLSRHRLLVISKAFHYKKVEIIHGKGVFTKVKGSIWNIQLKMKMYVIIINRPMNGYEAYCSNSEKHEYLITNLHENVMLVFCA